MALALWTPVGVYSQPMDSQPDRALELAYAEGTRALDEQRSSLDAARATASTALGIATIGTGFLSSVALSDRSGLPAFAAAAVVCLLVTVASTVLIIWPRSWVWSNDPKELLSDAWAGRSTDDVHRQMAGFQAKHLENNDGPLALCWKATTVAVVMASFSLICWLPLLGRN